MKVRELIADLESRNRFMDVKIRVRSHESTPFFLRDVLFTVVDFSRAEGQVIVVLQAGDRRVIDL